MLIGFLALGCKPATPTVAEADADTDADTDSDTDADTDSDTDSDTDTDTDIEVDPHTVTCYPDEDQDGYGATGGSPMVVMGPDCTAGTVQNDLDCDDTSSAITPFATEVCDGRDNNCDGFVDEGLPQDVEGWDDLDQDGFGAGTPTLACALLGRVANGDDCDDTSASSWPGNLETLGDGLDNDCDGADNRTPPAFGQAAWDRPVVPKVVRNDATYLIGTRADWSARPSGLVDIVNPDAALQAEFSSDPTDPAFPGYRAEPSFGSWTNTNPLSAQTLSSGFDLVTTGETIWYSNSDFNDATDIFKMGVVQRDYSALLGGYGEVHLARRINAFEGHHTDTESTLHLDSATTDEGWLWTTYCGGAGRSEPHGLPDEADGVLRQLVIRTPFTTAPSTQTMPINPEAIGGGTVEVLGNTADVCWHETTRVDAHNWSSVIQVCDVDGCQRFTSSITDPGTGFEGSVDPVSTASTYAGRGIIEADVHDDLLVLVEAAGVVVEATDGNESWTAFAGRPVISADAVRIGGDLYVAAVVAATPVNTVELAFGSSTDFTNATVVELSTQDDDLRFEGGVGCNASTGVGCTPGRELDPDGVGLHVDDARVVVAFSARTPEGWVPSAPVYGSELQPGAQDAVGWVFMAPPTP